MDKLNLEIQKLADSLNKKPVFGKGLKNAKILLLGEAPGSKEEETGIPFAGSAGKNLNEFLEILNITREEIYITNTVKVRPSKINEKTGRVINRPPTEKEKALFADVLLREIKKINPKIIVTLGNTALQALLGKDAKIGDLHGSPVKKGDFNIFPLYHPAAIIYKRSLKDEYILDLNNIFKLSKMFD